MTNADYIKSKLSDVDIAWMLRNGGRFADTKSSLIERAYKAWTQWAESASNNHGNMAKGSTEKRKSKRIPPCGIGLNGNIQTERGKTQVERKSYLCRYG